MGSAQAFKYDALALEIALESIDEQFDHGLHPLQALFFYLPLEHAENLELQERCVMLFEQLAPRATTEMQASFKQFLDYACRHRDVIRRFGRFPHRNQILGRISTPEEIKYLESGGEKFG